MTNIWTTLKWKKLNNYYTQFLTAKVFHTNIIKNKNIRLFINNDKIYFQGDANLQNRISLNTVFELNKTPAFTEINSQRRESSTSIPETFTHTSKYFCI